MILLIIPDRKSEILSEHKNFTHAFRLIKDTHFIGLVNIIFDIEQLFVYRTTMILPYGSAYHKLQDKIQINTLVLNSDDLNFEFQDIGLAIIPEMI